MPSGAAVCRSRSLQCKFKLRGVYALFALRVNNKMAVAVTFMWLMLCVLARAAWANTSGVQTGLDMRFVSTVPSFQRAINDGVKHVVLTEHLSAISAQQEIIGTGVSLDSAIGSIQPNTKSIVVRLATLLQRCSCLRVCCLSSTFMKTRLWNNYTIY